MIRPEIRALFRRWRGVIEGAALILFGSWIFAGGTIVPQLAGLLVMALGLGWAINARARMRFQADPSAPGLIEVDEGRIRFLHPVMGGEVSLNDLSELKLVQMKGRRMWQMRDLSGAQLIVPLESAGAEGLVDAFASLPGLGAGDLVQALNAVSPATGTTLPAAAMIEHRVWTRPGSGLHRL